MFRIKAMTRFISALRRPDEMVREVETLPATMLVAEAIAFFTEPDARHKGYPVVDAAKNKTTLAMREKHGIVFERCDSD